MGNPYRNRRTGRFASNPTARAMHYVCWLWQLGDWKRLAAANDEGPGDQPAAA